MKPAFEKINLKEEQSIASFAYTGDVFDAPWHFHPEYELTFIISATGMRYVGNNISDFGPGDLVLLGSNLPHCWITDENCEDQSRSIVIQWGNEVFHDIPEMKAVRDLLQNSSRGLRFHSENHEDLISKMKSTVDMSAIQRYQTLLSILNELARDSEYTRLAGASYATDLSSNTNDRIEKIQKYVRENFQQKIKLKEVASELFMTEQSFSRFFSKVMGRPFFVFLNEFRVNIASRMLVETDRQVAEIGFHCGYESLSFFYEQFKKFKIYSPSEFRKMYRRI